MGFVQLLRSLNQTRSQNPFTGKSRIQHSLTPPSRKFLIFVDLPGYTRSVYKRDRALITPESHVYSPLPDWYDKHIRGVFDHTCNGFPFCHILCQNERSVIIIKFFIFFFIRLCGVTKLRLSKRNLFLRRHICFFFFFVSVSKA
ncbi:hypothetical protein YC2023_058124 [Brassica napus]